MLLCCSCGKNIEAIAKTQVLDDLESTYDGSFSIDVFEIDKNSTIKVDGDVDEANVYFVKGTRHWNSKNYVFEARYNVLVKDGEVGVSMASIDYPGYN